MKNVYMVQPSDIYGSGEDESVYLPYASGMLIAYSFRDDTIKNNYGFGRFVYRKENIDKAIDSFEDPAIVGFSTYVWNEEYNKEFARKLKEKYPECKTVFGGHNIRIDSCEQMEQYPFMDFIVHGEGEIAFAAILKAMCTDGDYSGIPNISYRNNGVPVKNREEKICTFDYPSPYLDGWFDDILKSGEIRYSVLFETNRGCPHHCAYCDWGSVTLPVRFFSKERVFRELEWFGQKKIKFCFCIDANFGMYPRDFEIVDEFLRVREEYGMPHVFKCCTTEGGTTEFAINKKLNDSNLFKGASLSLQTMSEEALKNIGRKNMTIDRFRELTAMYNKEGIPTFSEVIYGLPGETYESFSDNLDMVMKAGTTKSFYMHYCELLMNSQLGKKENIEKYKIKTARTPFMQFHSTVDNVVREYQDIVVSTYSMDYDSWIKTCIFGLSVQCFYYMGLLKYVAQYCYFEHDVSYKRFFEELILFAEKNPDTVIGRFYSVIYSKLSALMRNEEISVAYSDPKYGAMEYPLEEAMYLECVIRADEFFNELDSFVFDLIGNDPVLKEVLAYQKLVLRKPDEISEQHTFSADFRKYFFLIDINKKEDLVFRKNTIKTKNKIITSTLEEFGRVNAWYGRKHLKNLYTQEETEQIFHGA